MLYGKILPSPHAHARIRAHRHTQGQSAGRRACGADVQRCAARAAHHGGAGVAGAFAIRHLPAGFQSAIRGRPGGGGGGGEPRHRGAGAAPDRSGLRGAAGGDRHGAGDGAGRAGDPRRAGFHARSTTRRTTLPATFCARSATWKKASAQSDYVFEREFRTHRQQHTPLEPHITICWLDAERPPGDPHQHAGAVPLPPAGGP